MSALGIHADHSPAAPVCDPELKPAVRRCRVCGCTQNHACEGGCWWVEYDLCSACTDEPEDFAAEQLSDGVDEALDKPRLRAGARS